MKIVHIMAGAKQGGAETAFAELCAAQARAGFDIHAVCRPSDRNNVLEAAGVPITYMPFGGFFDFKTKPAIQKLFDDLKPQIVVTWMNRAAKKLPKNDKSFAWIAR